MKFNQICFNLFRAILIIAFVFLIFQHMISGDEEVRPKGLPYDRGLYGFNLTSGFNERRGKGIHGAWDIALPTNTPLYATMPGQVIMKINSIAGGFVSIKYGRFEVTVCHISEPTVLSGFEVKYGQLIGYSGSTGESTGPHVHYTIRENGIPVQPQRFMK